VLQVPVAHSAKQRVHRYIFTVFHAVSRFPKISQQTLVRGAVLGQTGKSSLFQQLLLAPEVQDRKLDKPLQQLAQLFPATPPHYSQTKLIQGIHQDAVLVVHGPNANRAGMTPG